VTGILIKDGGTLKAMKVPKGIHFEKCYQIFQSVIRLKIIYLNLK